MINFTFGVMGSGKTAALIDYYNKATAEGLKVVVVRTLNPVESRDGRFLLSVPVNVFLARQEAYDDVDVIIVDESQFLTDNQITKLEELAKLRMLSLFGLLYDFNDVMFQASKRILLFADRVIRQQAPCSKSGCSRLATSHNCVDNNLAKDNYKAVCCLHKEW